MLAVWLAVASLGTAVAQPAAQPSPSAASAKLSKDWRRVAIDDFEVVGNAPEKELRRTLAEIENFRATLSAIVPGLVTTSHKKTILIALRDPATPQPIRRGHA